VNVDHRKTPAKLHITQVRLRMRVACRIAPVSGTPRDCVLFVSETIQLMIGGYLTVYGILMYSVSGHSTGYRCVAVSTRGRGVRALRGGWCGADDQRWHLLVSVAAIANPHRTHLYRPTAAGSHATSNDTLWHLT